MRALSKPRRMLVPLIALPVSCAALAHAESVDALYEKAKLEKTLVLYGAGPTGSHDRWIKDFEQRFPGVTVALTGGLSNGLNQKIEQQLAAKRMETDLAIFQTIQDFGKWKKAGALLLFKPEGSDTIDAAYKDEDGAFTAVSVNTVVYAYNTRLLPAAEVPKSALDFLQPRFRGQLITTDPTEDDAAISVFNMIVEKYGWDYMDKYMAQQPSFVTIRPRRGVERNRRGREARDLQFHLDHAAAQGAGQADRAGILAGRPDAGVPGGRRDLQGRAAPQRRQALSHLVSGQGAAEPQRHILAARRRPSARRPGAALVLQHRQPVPYPGVGRGAADGIAQTARQLHRAAVRMTPSLSLPGDPAIHLLTEMPSSLAKVMDPRVKPAGDG